MRARRGFAFLTAVIAALALGACGGEEPQPAQDQPAPEGRPGQTPGDEPEEPTTTADSGQQIFSDQCSQCHTLADADATGTFGPNLDELEPNARRVERQVRQGGGGMPAFEGELSDEQIRAVAEYVEEATGR